MLLFKSALRKSRLDNCSKGEYDVTKHNPTPVDPKSSYRSPYLILEEILEKI